MGKRRAPRAPRVLLVAAVAALLCTAYVARAPLGAAAWAVAHPLLAARDALFGGESAALRAALAAQEAQLADRDALYAENVELKRLLNRAAGRSVTVAGIIQRPPGTPYDTLVIDAGRGEGILEGSLVSLGGSALVGSVTEVMPHAARVTLYSAAGAVHQGMLMIGGKAVPVSVEGQGGGSMRAQVPAGTGAAPGDVVVLPGVGLGLMAEVRYVARGAGESFETIYFALPGDLNARFVEIWQ